MPRALPLPLRQLVIQRCQDGHDPITVAHDLGLKPDTVRRLVRRLRSAGPEAIAPGYRRCGSSQPTADPVLIAHAVDLRRQHPDWGAGFLQVRLLEMFPEQTTPCVRTLQRHLARAGLNPAPPGRRQDAPPRRATHAHEVWQLDAAEQVALGSGEWVSWARVVDEASGAVLATAVFPPPILEQCSAHRDAGVSPDPIRALGTTQGVAGG
jgi:hypothetical protein